MPRKRRRSGLNPAVITGLVIAGAVVLAFAGLNAGWLKTQVANFTGVMPGMPLMTPNPTPLPTMIAIVTPMSTPMPTPLKMLIPTPTSTPTPTAIKPIIQAVATPTPTPFVGTPPCNVTISFFSRLLRAAVGNPCFKSTPTPTPVTVIAPVTNKLVPTPTPVTSLTPATCSTPLTFFSRLSRSLRAAVGAAPAAPCAVAHDDAYALASAGNILAVPVPGVKGNDTVPPGWTVRPDITSGPSHGQVTFGAADTPGINPDGDFRYSAAAGFSGVDTFKYVLLRGGTTVSGEATVTIAVGSVATGPPFVLQAYPDRYDLVGPATALDVPVARGVLTNDTISPPAGDAPFVAVVVMTGPRFGILNLNSDGSFGYTYTAGATLPAGSDQFTYALQRNNPSPPPTLLTRPAVVTINFLPAVGGLPPGVPPGGGPVPPVVQPPQPPNVAAGTEETLTVKGKYYCVNKRPSGWSATGSGWVKPAGENTGRPMPLFVPDPVGQQPQPFQLTQEKLNKAFSLCDSGGLAVKWCDGGNSTANCPGGIYTFQDENLHTIQRLFCDKDAAVIGPEVLGNPSDSYPFRPRTYFPGMPQVPGGSSNHGTVASSCVSTVDTWVENWYSAKKSNLESVYYYAPSVTQKFWAALNLQQLKLFYPRLKGDYYPWKTTGAKAEASF